MSFLQTDLRSVFFTVAGLSLKAVPLAVVFLAGNSVVQFSRRVDLDLSTAQENAVSYALLSAHEISISYPSGLSYVWNLHANSVTAQGSGANQSYVQFNDRSLQTALENGCKIAETLISYEPSILEELSDMHWLLRDRANAANTFKKNYCPPPSVGS